ncbi:MAG TPA: c-type cytochrome, partial [Gemmataceae bacterium]|nr:c-type cytochrome [Gemmataceae bacterium]
LPAEVLKTADLDNGRALFTKHCGACHKMFGDGGDTAPELTGSQRTSLDYVFENVLDPSAVVPNEYRLVNFTMSDGRLVSGIVLKETPAAVTVRTVNDTFVLSAADIESRKQTSQSIMPEGLLDALKPDEVRDLVAYLGTPHQVPVPKK